MIEQLRKNDFAVRLTERFTVQMDGAAPVEVLLVELIDRSTENCEVFSLLFRGPKDRVFRHDTYLVTHPGMGEFSLFLGPVAVDKSDGVYYEAVFNRIINCVEEG